MKNSAKKGSMVSGFVQVGMSWDLVGGLEMCNLCVRVCNVMYVYKYVWMGGRYVGM